ncbi:hypothetical protein A9Q94_09125 [Rhodobacterales bacterium 56_14_T64]|nr:hypothetical protein A9Q94_09125 [Rhodobacterales bacterium 56_14_T64]
MLMMVNAYARDLIVRFQHDEEGLALTEYLLLLGLLTGAVITAVTLFGTNLTAVWNGWAVWIGTLSTTGPSS